MVKLKFIKKINTKKGRIISCIVSGLIALFAISFNIGERIYVENNNNPDRTVFMINKATDADFKDEIIIYDAMHRMANSKLPLSHKDKSGRLEISNKQIEAVKKIVEQMNYPDKSYIFSVLERWAEGNFTYVKDEHDYFWSRLGGNVGAAALTE